MFIALQRHYPCAPAERHVLGTLLFTCRSLRSGIDQDAGAINMLLLRSKNLDSNDDDFSGKAA